MSRMARIVFVNRYFAPDHSATSQLLSDLAFYLAAEGREVHVVASNELYGGGRALPARETLNGVHVHRVPSGGFGRSGLLARAADYAVLYAAMGRAAFALARAGDVLVAKTDPPLLSIPLALVAKLRGARLVNWLQDLYPEVAGALGVPLLGGAAGAALARVRDASLRSAQLNVVIGERMGERLAARGLDRSRVAVVQNWANDDDIAPAPVGANPLRREWGLEGKFVLAYSGNLGRAHEYDTLLGAADLLRDRRDLAFLFVGGGAHVEEMRRRAEARGLERAFCFQPYQDRDRLGDSLGAANAHWLSLREGLEGLIVPSKFYGVAAAARATVAVTALDGEVARAVRANGCGFVAAPGDSATLAAAIARLADDGALCAAMGARARAMLEAGLTRAHALRRWTAVLDAAMAGRPVPAAPALPPAMLREPGKAA
ncbi:MAG: putative colanic acid biosynthesis glycosyl transferase [Hyphomicrobiales bacterium]|nr:putative colanic acid biosynthesis glycosyl transferase [Hyphomicrobiales bacterium]